MASHVFRVVALKLLQKHKSPFKDVGNVVFSKYEPVPAFRCTALNALSQNSTNILCKPKRNLSFYTKVKGTDKLHISSCFIFIIFHSLNNRKSDITHRALYLEARHWHRKFEGNDDGWCYWSRCSCLYIMHLLFRLTSCSGYSSC